jgi:hypothetical protein
MSTIYLLHVMVAHYCTKPHVGQKGEKLLYYTETEQIHMPSSKKRLLKSRETISLTAHAPPFFVQISEKYFSCFVSDSISCFVKRAWKLFFLHL